MLFETLESRRLLSVSVSEAYPGYYEIVGDNSANVIEASVSMQNDTFTFNGVTYSDVLFISVDAQGGDDTIRLLSTGGTPVIGAGITAGSGNDTIMLNFDGAVWAGSGNDTLQLSDAFRGEAYGDAGNDQISISGECLDAEIRGGDGNDLINCSQNNYSVIVHAGAGNDTIIGSENDDQLYGDEGEDWIYARGGDDEIYYANGDHVDGGAGYDILYSSNPDGTVNIEELIG